MKSVSSSNRRRRLKSVASLGIGRRLIARLPNPLAFFLRAKPDAQCVERLAETVVAEPTSRKWLLVIASESTRVRRALISRAALDLRLGANLPDAADALEQLADEQLLHAVTTLLLQRQGLAPLLPAKRTGPSARIKFTELAARYEACGSSLLTA